MLESTLRAHRAWENPKGDAQGKSMPLFNTAAGPACSCAREGRAALNLVTMLATLRAGCTYGRR